MDKAKVRVIKLTSEMMDEEVDKLSGKMLDDKSYDTVVNFDADVYKPNGDVLFKFRKGIISEDMVQKTFRIWYKAAVETDNRGMAAGEIDNLDEIREGNAISTIGGKRAVILKKDGTISKTTRARRVKSGIVGFFDRNARFPYCRLTAFNIEHMAQFQDCVPMIQHVDNTFKELMPERWQAQMDVYKDASKDFKIPGTSFTTITVNRNFRTAVHQDQGDLKQGFGVMCAMRTGTLKGAFTIFPKYRVAVDMGTHDLVCADVHEWHSNSPFHGIPGTYERISLVFYFREGIKTCGTAEEERKRAMERTEAFYERTAAK